MWSRRAMLGGLAAAACAPGGGALPAASGGTAPVARARNLIVVQAYGGWDTTYAIDPKPDTTWMDLPPGDVRTFGNLPIWADPSRPRTAEFFERHHERVAIVHGINVRSVDHNQCLRWLLTGTRDPKAPDVCAISASTLGADLPVPYLMLSDRAFLGPFGGNAARAGGMNQIASLADPTQRFPSVDGTVAFDPDPDERAAIEAFRRARAPVGTVGALVGARSDVPLARARAERLREVVQWLGVAGAPQGLDEQIETALAFLEGGLARSVTLDSLAYFDTHGRNDLQAAAHESTFQHLVALFDALESRPGREGGSLLDETVVAVVSEMGRSGALNAADGKDHWPFASALVAGAGIRGDRVYGATDEAFLGVTVDLATGAPDGDGVRIDAERFTAGLLGAVGVDPAEWLPGIEPLHAFYET